LFLLTINEARREGEGIAMRETVTTGKAPAAIGPYSQAVRSGGFLFCSGQIPLDPATGKMVEGGIEAQTERVLRNLEAVLAAGGASPATVVKTTVYLTDLGDFPLMNAVYGTFFPSAPPARATVQVAKLPAGALVEIDAIAITG
jgi:2-iminobutanoate/2-iminopropanoate deaminase